MDEFMDCETGIEIVDLAEKYWLTSDRILCVEREAWLNHWVNDVWVPKVNQNRKLATACENLAKNSNNQSWDNKAATKNHFQIGSHYLDLNRF